MSGSSRRNPSFLPRFCSASRITLSFPSLRNQIPESGLQRWPARRVGKSPLGELFGLGCVTLRQPNLRQSIQHLRFAWRDAHGALQTGRRAAKIAFSFLFPCDSQQRKHWPVELLVTLKPT